MKTISKPIVACRCALALTVLLAALWIPTATRADTLLIERLEGEASQTVPNRGSSMAQVRARFGEPAETRAPVGGDRPRHPPITRWVYSDFTVYFERDRVIDSVLNRAPPAAAANSE